MNRSLPTFRLLACLVLAFSASQVGAEDPHPQAVEVGAVKWGRTYQAATAEAKKTGKPILVLFQEVPG